MGQSISSETPSAAPESYGDEADVFFDSDESDDGLFGDTPAVDDEITDDEFEALLDELSGTSQPSSSPSKAAPPPSSSTTPEASAAGESYISDDEFESLLDEIHGKGAGPSVAAASANNTSNIASSSSVMSSVSSGGDMISDDEFESLLDELHGKGAAPTQKNTGKVASAPASSPRPRQPRLLKRREQLQLKLLLVVR